MKEAQFKSLFKKSVRAQKGFSISLSAPLVIGTPDLYVIMPGFVPILLEAKWFDELKPGFKRKIPYTALQRDFINSCNDVYNCTAFGLVGFKIGKELFCTMTVHDIIDYNHGVYLSPVAETKLFDVKLLFGTSGVPRLNGHA